MDLIGAIISLIIGVWVFIFAGTLFLAFFGALLKGSEALAEVTTKPLAEKLTGRSE